MLYRGCDYLAYWPILLVSIGPIDMENHLLPYNLTSFVVPSFTVASGV